MAFLDNRNIRRILLLGVLLASLGESTGNILAQTFRIEHGPDAGIQIVVDGDDDFGFQIERSDNARDWNSAGNHLLGKQVLPVNIGTEASAFFRLRSWSVPAEPMLLVIIGDSTVADFKVVFGDSGGWGEALPSYFLPELRIVNLALPGVSTKNYLESSRNLSNLVRIKPDFVLIHYGVLDAVSQRESLRTTAEEFAENINTIVQAVRSVRATPILCTPVTTLAFDDNQRLRPILSAHSANVRQLATDLECPLVDLYRASYPYFNELGLEATLSLQGDPDDELHFNADGATVVAEMVLPLLPPFLQAYRLPAVGP